MKILFYDLSEKVNEGRLLSTLINLGLRKNSLPSGFTRYTFLNESEFDLERLAPLPGNQSQALEPLQKIIPFETILESFQGGALDGKFASQTVRIIELLIKARGRVAGTGTSSFIPPSGISLASLQTIIAYTYGLDLLNIGLIFTWALPLTHLQTLEEKLVESIYEICQTEVRPARNAETEISWVAAAMLAVLANFEVPPFRFLRTVNSLMDQGDGDAAPLQVIEGELNMAEDKAIVLIQTNIDDMSPESLGHAVNRLLQAGALDVYQIPVYMKKNRLGIRLNVVVRQRDEARLANLILKETSTLGITVQRMEHNYHAEMRMVEVKTKYGNIPVKQKYIDGVLIQSKPEYEITAKIASELQVPIDELNSEILEQIKQINRQS